MSVARNDSPIIRTKMHFAFGDSPHTPQKKSHEYKPWLRSNIKPLVYRVNRHSCMSYRANIWGKGVTFATKIRNPKIFFIFIRHICKKTIRKRHWYNFRGAIRNPKTYFIRMRHICKRRIGTIHYSPSFFESADLWGPNFASFYRKRCLRVFSENTHKNSIFNPKLTMKPKTP